MFFEDVKENFLIDLEIRHYTTQTIMSYTKRLSMFQCFLENEKIKNIEDITSLHLRKFLKVKIKSCKSSYVNTFIKIFRIFFQFAQEEEYIDNNPMDKIKWVKEDKVIIKTYTNEDIKKILKYYSSKKDYNSIKNQTIIKMLFDTGIRCNELCNLKEEDIHEDFIIIFGKGNKERSVPISPKLKKQIYKYRRAKEKYFYNNTSKYFILGRTGQKMLVCSVEKIFIRLKDKLDIDKTVRCSPHTIRHCFAQAQLKNGLDVYSLSRLLGHENINITQRYLQGLQDDEIIKRSISTSPLMNL